MSIANTIIRLIGTILSSVRHLCVVFNKRKKGKYGNKEYREKKEYSLKKTHKAKVIRQVVLKWRDLG